MHTLSGLLILLPLLPLPGLSQSASGTIDIEACNINNAACESFNLAQGPCNSMANSPSKTACYCQDSLLEEAHNCWWETAMPCMTEEQAKHVLELVGWRYGMCGGVWSRKYKEVMGTLPPKDKTVGAAATATEGGDDAQVTGAEDVYGDDTGVSDGSESEGDDSGSAAVDMGWTTWGIVVVAVGTVAVTL